MEKKELKRSEKWKEYKDFGIPRYLMLSEKDKKKECMLWVFVSVLFLLLAVAGKNEIERYVGIILLFLVNAIGAFSK
ncbi:MULTISPECIES: hypothetical protein [Anaerococcus]|uniref:hypothetical protein n=1 Tax=Anaerococcus TaxID=165779 RepID=UPI00242C8160|nr:MULTISPECIES: hypothetical protein [Anaerococcus]MDD7766291.1 hypothetical protein [Anaerococcus vaginalis]MDY6127593.1 hypothetical protein [Anaerococcus sp.]